MAIYNVAGTEAWVGVRDPISLKAHLGSQWDY